MRIGQTGKITEDLYMLGHPAVPIYLLDGRVVSDQLHASR